MNFIKIRDGLSVAVDKIEAVEQVDDFSSKITTHFNVYSINLPYNIVLDMLEKDEKLEKK